MPSGAPKNDHEVRKGVVIPVVKEELEISKRPVPTSRTVVQVVPFTRQEVLDIPLTREEVEVERVPVNRVIDKPVAIRQYGDVTIIPVFEEVLVVEKRLMLKEEIRLTRRRTTESERKEVTLRGEEARVSVVEPESADES